MRWAWCSSSSRCRRARRRTSVTTVDRFPWQRTSPAPMWHLCERCREPTGTSTSSWTRPVVSPRRWRWRAPRTPRVTTSWSAAWPEHHSPWRPAAFSIGHGNREVNAAIAAQLDQVACGYRYLFTSEPLEQLTRLMLARCGPQFAHIIYSGSGSEAVESALKVALQYWDARGLPARKRFIARERSYHGNTLGALSVSGFLERRRPFEESLVDVS